MEGEKMENQNEKLPGGEQEQQASGDAHEQRKSDTVSYESYRKLLSEKKELAERFKKLQSQLDEIREAKLLESGKEREALEEAKARVREYESKYAEAQRKFRERILTEQIKQKAVSHGCVDPDALLKLSDLSGIEVDDDFNIKSGLDEAIVKLKQSKPYLFKEARPVNDLPPASGLRQKDFDLDKMSADEIANLLRQL